MPDKYQIILGIENSQADAAARASLKLMQAYERQCLAAAKAAQNAFNGNGHPGGTGTTQRPGNGDSVAFRKARSGVDLASKEAAAYDKIQERKLRSEEKAADRAAAAQQRDILRSAKAAEQEAARFEKLEERKRLSAEKSAARDAARAEKAAARESAQAEKAAARATKAAEPKVDIGLHKLQIDSIKATDARLAAEEKNAAQLAAIQDKFYLKDYQAKVKAEKKKEAIDDLTRSRTQKAIKGLEGMEESYRVRDYKARVAQEKRKEALEGGPAANAAKFRRKALDDEQAHAVAVNRITDVQNKRKVEGIAKIMGEQRLSFAEAINSALGLDSALSKVGIAMAGLAAGRSIVLGISGAFIEARENAKKFATTTLDFMVQLRPLASVMGVAPTFEFAKKVAQFGAETGMGKAGAASFLESFAGRAQITRGKQISEPEYEKFTTVAGKMTTARGIPTDIAGDLFASVLKIENFLKKGQGANEAMARAGALFDILDAGSGKIAQLAPQAQQLMASLASENELEGVFKTAGEVGVVTSLMAENIPGEAAVFGRSLVKAYGTFEDKDRQPFYKRAGIVPGMSALERIRKANLVIGEEVGKGRSLEEVVRGFGLAGNVREKTAVETAYKARDTVLKPQLERLAAAEKPGGVAAVQAQLDKRFRDKDILYTQAQAAVEAADILPEGLSAEIYRKRAEEQLKKERFETDPLQFAKQKLAAVASFGRKAGRDVAIEARAISMARREAGLSPYVSLGEAVYGNTDETINSLIRARGNRPGLVGPGGGAPAALPQAQPGNDPVLLQLKRIADSNEAMAKKEGVGRNNVPAPPAQPVAGPAQLSGR